MTDTNNRQDLNEGLALARRDALRALAGMLRGDGIEVEAGPVPARWSIAGTHIFTLPGGEQRKLKARFRATVGPIPDVEEELRHLLARPEGIDRADLKSLAKRVKVACRDSDALEQGVRRIEEWVESMVERAEAFGDAWRPRGFADELVRVLGFGGRVPRLETLLDALEEAFSTAAARAGIKVRRRMLETASGLGVYLDSFAAARAMIRRLRLFVGPTNSGKTHAAMDRLAIGETGAYLAPLRLLALEGQEALEARGRPCSLITGEERDVRPGAAHVSSTVEMANTQRVMDVCVIDEIQMIGDPDRGWAWTQAVAGMAASEIVMTGSADAIPYVRRIAEATGEDLEIVEFTRKSPLRTQEERVSMRDIRRGDAVVAFGRRDVMALRAELLRRDHGVAVIYGALSPEVRRAEARRFRDGEADVLVATDAIGMGLNLPIARIVLSTVRKFDGREERELTPSEIRQIGGRAGRFGMHEDGRVAVFEGESVTPVRRALTSPPVDPVDPRPWISPNTNHVEAIARELGTDSLAKVLRTAGQELLRAHQTFRMTDLEQRIQAAAAVDGARLSLSDRDTLSRCPIDTRDARQLRMLRIWAVTQGQGGVNAAPGLEDRFTREIGTDVELEAAEKAVKDMTAYSWLAYRFPEAYPEMDVCQERRRILNGFIERTLKVRSLQRACVSCGRHLKASHRFRICDVCFAKNDGDGAGGSRGRRFRHGPDRAVSVKDARPSAKPASEKRVPGSVKGGSAKKRPPSAKPADRTGGAPRRRRGPPVA